VRQLELQGHYYKDRHLKLWPCLLQLANFDNHSIVLAVFGAAQGQHVYVEFVRSRLQSLGRRVHTNADRINDCEDEQSEAAVQTRSQSYGSQFGVRQRRVNVSLDVANSTFTELVRGGQHGLQFGEHHGW
jgi:hypothetical protein